MFLKQRGQCSENKLDDHDSNDLNSNIEDIITIINLSLKRFIMFCDKTSYSADAMLVITVGSSPRESLKFPPTFLSLH